MPKLQFDSYENNTKDMLPKLRGVYRIYYGTNNGIHSIG